MQRLLKRWWLWLRILVLLGIVGAGYLLLPVQASRISQANCDKIQVGWGLEEVKELLAPSNSFNMWAIHNGQDDVGEEQVHPTLSEDVQRFLGVVGGQYPKSLLGQHPDDEVASGALVFDNQDGAEVCHGQ